jgi:FAD/FMN-containing dehydrogenase
MKRRTFVRSALAAGAAVSIPRSRSFAALFQEAPQEPPDVPAITGAGNEVVLPGKDIAELAARMDGRVLLAGEDGYDAARLLLNPSFDKYPALVVQPTGVADIRVAVDFARDHGNLLLAVKCGGHSASGKSTCDSGMQIDLSLFRDVRVDPQARRVWASGGSLLGPVDHEAMAFGLVTPMGTVSHTGAGGLVTGGGFGRLARRYGLAIDNLVSVNLVAADGKWHHTSAEENPDLFWAVRGGGGNFGIVTSFEFQLHPMQRQVVGGYMVFPIESARDLLVMYSEYSHEAPDDLSMGFFISYPDGEDPRCGIGICYSGPENEAEKVLAPITKVGTPIVDGFEAMDYVALQKSGDSDDPRARASYLKSGFINDMPAGLITAIVEGIEGAPGRDTAVFFQQSGGAINRVANDATAFSYRDAMGNLLSAVDWAYGDDPSAYIAWERAYWKTLEPFTKGWYVNDQPSDGGITVNANFRGNYDRLARIKTEYDPDNLFRLNANILPSS